MSHPGRVAAAGVGSALAVSLPGALLAQILDSVRDDDLPAWMVVPLLLAVLTGPVVGGCVVAARTGGRSRRVLAVAVGAVAIGFVAGLGALRRSVAGDSAELAAVPALMLVGAALAATGAALHARRTARTRP